MSDNITGLIGQIQRDVINYTKLHNIEVSKEKIEEIVNYVVKVSCIDIGEDTYFHSDVVEAIKNIIE